MRCSGQGRWLQSDQEDSETHYFLCSPPTTRHEFDGICFALLCATSLYIDPVSSHGGFECTLAPKTNHGRVQMTNSENSVTLVGEESE